DLDPLLGFLDPNANQGVLEQLASTLRTENYAQAMLSSTSRIFDLISAIKTFSYMDRAPILEVDVPAGLDATLQMLQSRMTQVTIEREYEANLPHISAYGSELNQVWTALIENALDAMGNQGLLRLAWRPERQSVRVEIWEHGAGIPPAG